MYQRSSKRRLSQWISESIHLDSGQQIALVPDKKPLPAQETGDSYKANAQYHIVSL
jgi:hypothetical protein